MNILRGDLSTVGPRPEQPRYVQELIDKIPFYDLRHRVRPGLTGWAQVKYAYGASDSDAMEKLQYEFFYLRHQSLVARPADPRPHRAERHRARRQIASLNGTDFMTGTLLVRADGGGPMGAGHVMCQLALARRGRGRGGGGPFATANLRGCWRPVGVTRVSS